MNQKLRNDINYAFSVFYARDLPPIKGCPTWWFKFEIPQWTTPQIRAELKKMQAEGLVTVPYSRRGQTHWEPIIANTRGLGDSDINERETNQ